VRLILLNEHVFAARTMQGKTNQAIVIDGEMAGVERMTGVGAAEIRRSSETQKAGSQTNGE
jgi:hypothetical protein